MATESPLPPRYGDVRLLARGGMGDIYVARDRELRRPVAVKVLIERFASDPDIRQRFKREALAAARLSGHPHIVAIFDVGEWDGRPFIVMEYLAGGTLGDRAKGRPVSPPQALAWLQEAAEALDAAYAEGIVHRDVKPANLLFDARGELHVADFGIARILDDTGGLTMTGTILGTAGYISPEQAQGSEATAASDVYSLGVVAYELLTGSRPFARPSATAEAAAHAHEPVPPASERNPDLPPEVDDVFERALAKEPSARHLTARELVADLREALGAAAATGVQEAAAPTTVFRRSRRLLPIGAAALLLAGGGVAAAMLTAADGDGSEQVRTVVRRTTVTTQGRPLVKRVTVTQTIQPPPAPPPAAVTPPPPVTPPPAPPVTPPPPAATPPPAPVASSASGAQLNDDGYDLMRAGQYSQALPLLQQAVRKLQDTYRSDYRFEAYANYNLGYTLLQLGRCSEAVPYLDRSEALQGYRVEIDEAQADAERCIAAGEDRAGS